MKRLILCTALALAATPVLAFDPADMSRAEREAFNAAVRDYLMANPGLVYEMLAAIEGQRLEDEASADLQRIAKWSEDLFRRPGDPVLGNPDGDVTLVMFTDYRCPYCRATEADLAEMIAADPGLRIVVKHYPILTPESATAAAFALAVADIGGNAAHLEAHARLFDLRGGYSEASLARLATDLGLPADAVLERMRGEDVKNRIASTLALGSEFGFDATPSFVLPQLLVRGQMPKEVMEGYVEEARARAE